MDGTRQQRCTRHYALVNDRAEAMIWTAEELHEFGPLEERWTERAKYSITVPKLVSRWARFVTVVEAGYGENRMIEEYWNDLDMRLLLQEALDALSEETAGRLRQAVEPWDRRFRAATVETDPALWSGGWWAARVPANPVPYFAEEVRQRLASRRRT